MNTKQIPELMTEIVITQSGQPEVLKPRISLVPKPGINQVLVRVEAAGVNRPDVLQRMGKYPMPSGVNPTPGLEVSGEIVAIGGAVTGFAVGDKVCGLTEGGGYAEYCLLPTGQTLPRPAGVDSIHAAAIPETFFTVWSNLFRIGKAVRGDTVLIHGGASGIGSTALMLAKEFGIRTCTTVSDHEKCIAALDIGAELAINYHEQDFANVALEWTNGHGVDVILDIIGASYLEKNIEALAKDGRLLLVGFLSGEVAESINLLKIALNRLTLTGSTMRSSSAQEKAIIAEDLFNNVWPLLSAGKCLPIIHETFPLARASDAHRMMESGKHIGKIVLHVSN